MLKLFIEKKLCEKLNRYAKPAKTTNNCVTRSTGISAEVVHETPKRVLLCVGAYGAEITEPTDNNTGIVHDAKLTPRLAGNVTSFGRKARDWSLGSVCTSLVSKVQPNVSIEQNP